MSLAADQRRALCELFLEVGPHAPTLCEGWQAQDLAAHLWVREHRPLALPGIGLSRFAERTAQVQMNALHTLGFQELVAQLRKPALWVRPADRLVNAAEYFIHHEDVLRANGREQKLSRNDEAELLRVLQLLSWRAQRVIGERLVLAPVGWPEWSRGAGARTLRLAGPPAELLLWLSGRQDAAKVSAVGEPELVANLRDAKLGL